MNAQMVMEELSRLEDPTQAEFATRFFKTGEGEYGEGDIFIGLRVPVVRRVAKSFRLLSLSEIEKLLESPIHEHRLCALIIMTEQAKKVNETQKKALFDLYLKRTDRINNWDLVDVSCRQVIGGYLQDKPRDILYELAQSKDLWERRIAIISTWEFIRKSDLDDTFKIAELLLYDKHDLIHKAAGWMLREAGKRNEDLLKEFLDTHAGYMPRTMLRYAIERLNAVDKQYYMRIKAA